MPSKKSTERNLLNSLDQNGFEKTRQNTLQKNHDVFCSPVSLAAFKSPKSPNFDPENEDYVKELIRPAVIKEDLYQVERSQRVRQVLGSSTFKEELEKLIISEQAKVVAPDSDSSCNLRSLEHLSAMISPHHGLLAGRHAILPISDLRGVAASKYSKSERLIRNKFSSLFRLIDLFKWSNGISNHCTTRLPSNSLLINPSCLMYHEVSASTLLKIDEIDGKVQNGGIVVNNVSSEIIAANLGEINNAIFQLHCAIYRKRGDIQCIVHLSTPLLNAIAAMKCGLLPLGQESMIIGEISYHDFRGLEPSDSSEYDAIVNDLGPKNRILLLRNYGFFVCASSIEQAFDVCYNLMQACETQIRAIRVGVENLIIPNDAAQEKVRALVDKGNVLSKVDTEQHMGTKKWKLGELEWEAWMRVLDNAGYRTGHIYVQPISNLVKSQLSKSEIEIPPSASSYGYDTVDFVPKDSSERYGFSRSSPFGYTKSETSGRASSLDAKKVAKWILAESPQPYQYPSQTIQTAPSVAEAHKFLPQILPTAPAKKELKTKQRQIKEQCCDDNITAGPQSKVLEGVTYQDVVAFGAGEQKQKILIGAASKGIVDKDRRHDERIFKHLLYSNPFSHETDQRLNEYIEEVKSKTVGQPISSIRSNSNTLDCYEVGSGRSESPESFSLMQVTRELNLSRDVATSTPIHTLATTGNIATETDTDSKSISPSHLFHSSPGILEQQKQAEMKYHESTRGRTSEKKKKSHKFSFLKAKKDKD